MIARVREDAPAVGITGIGAYVPVRIVSSEDVGAGLGVNADWIVERSGIRERRVAAADEAASDLAVPAARQALERSRVAPGEVGLVIVATASPDMPLPATASIVASELGAEDAAAYDLSAASTGFVYGLAQAYANVAAGLVERALVIGAEVLSRLTDPADRGTAILFADGAGAVVVERVADGGFLGFDLGSDGSGASDILVPAGGSRVPSTEATVAAGLHAIQMNGQKIFRFSTRVTADSVERLVSLCGLSNGGRRPLRASSVEPADHRSHGAPARHSTGEGRGRHRSLRQHVERVDSSRARRRAGRRPAQRGRHGAPHGRRGRAHVGLRAPSLERCSVKVAFCFPGQGSHEVGMGRAFAETLPEADEVFEVGSEVSGLDLRRLCFEGPLEELTETEIQQPALVTASLACLRAVEASRSAAGCRRRALGR